MSTFPLILATFVAVVGAAWLTSRPLPLSVTLIRAATAFVRWQECLVRAADAGYVRYRMERTISVIETDSEQLLAQFKAERDAAEKAARGAAKRQAAELALAAEAVQQ